jgi:hypothetical protein
MGATDLRTLGGVHEHGEAVKDRRVLHDGREALRDP